MACLRLSISHYIRIQPLKPIQKKSQSESIQRESSPSPNERTLGYWLARSKEVDGGSFIPITGHSRSSSEQIEIIYPTGVHLRVENDLALIAQLIRL
jgi:hypothetical protein